MADRIQGCSIDSDKRHVYPLIYTVLNIPPALEIPWVVEGLLPTGLTVHGGRPECGKSWFALNVAISVATGVPLFGQFPTTKGKVLYMGLEDGPVRIMNRMKMLDSVAVDEISFCNSWPRFDTKSKGGQLLKAYISENPDVKLVVIDAWVKIRPLNITKNDEYQFIYPHLSALADLARDSGIAILVIHHTKKGNGFETEPNEKLLGSTAIAAASDCTLILTRESGKDNAELNISGRDVAEGKLRLDFRAGRFSLSESEQIKITNETDSKILEVLRLGGKRFTEIRNQADLPKSTTSKALKRLTERNIVMKNGELYEILQDYSNKIIN